MTEHPVPWLGEILRSAGDITPATAAEIQRAAGYGSQTWAMRGEVWSQYGARQIAKSVLAGLATERDPAVQAALRASQEAREQADDLFAATAGTNPYEAVAFLFPDETMAISRASHTADERHQEYSDLYDATFERYFAEAGQAWREVDMDFLRSHRAALEAADPGAVTDILEEFTEDPASRAASGQPGSAPSGMAQPTHVAVSGSDNAGDSRTRSPVEFPDAVTPGAAVPQAAPRQASGQASRPSARRTP